MERMWERHDPVREISIRQRMNIVCMCITDLSGHDMTNWWDSRK